jgi:hypothetical protein
MPSCERGAADLRELFLVDLAFVLAHDEVMPVTIGVEREIIPVSPRKLDMEPSSSTKNAELISSVASSTVTMRSRSCSRVAIQRCFEPSWNSSISGNGRRAHLLRRAPRLAFATSPVACSDNGVTQSL